MQKGIKLKTGLMLMALVISGTAWGSGHTDLNGILIRRSVCIDGREKQATAEGECYTVASGQTYCCEGTATESYTCVEGEWRMYNVTCDTGFVAQSPDAAETQSR